MGLDSIAFWGDAVSEPSARPLMSRFRSYGTMSRYER
jgi:hypothetical protein